MKTYKGNIFLEQQNNPGPHSKFQVHKKQPKTKTVQQHKLFIKNFTNVSTHYKWQYSQAGTRNDNNRTNPVQRFKLDEMGFITKLIKTYNRGYNQELEKKSLQEKKKCAFWKPTFFVLHRKCER